MSITLRASLAAAALAAAAAVPITASGAAAASNHYDHVFVIVEFSGHDIR